MFINRTSLDIELWVLVWFVFSCRSPISALWKASPALLKRKHKTKGRNPDVTEEILLTCAVGRINIWTARHFSAFRLRVRRHDGFVRKESGCAETHFIRVPRLLIDRKPLDKLTSPEIKRSLLIFALPGLHRSCLHFLLVFGGVSPSVLSSVGEDKTSSPLP